MNRMKELIRILNDASKEYYQGTGEKMSDYEYDKLYDELLALEEETGTVLSSSPTQRVGYTVLSSLQKVRHESPMLSLDKTKQIGVLKDWLKDKEGLLSWKLDGLTIALKYKDGVLSRAVTRGNGEIGEDVTHNAKVFANLPLKIPFTGELSLRGEGVISYSDFLKINESLPDENKFKNPRNLSSGAVRQLNSEVSAKRRVMFYAFSLISAEGMDDFKFKKDGLDWLKALGFEVVENKLVTAESLEETIREFEKNISKKDFTTDGLVLTYNDIAYSESLGATSKFPKDSIAFKWADELAETTLLEIIWHTSRTGLINPIAVFEPVEIEGTSVSRASVHNISILKGLKLGIGDRLKVYKANMIIPQIAENLTKSDNISIPEVCNVCGGETETRSLADVTVLYCTNPNCHAQRVQAISHYCGRDAMNIEGISKETIAKFVEKGFLDTYADIYNLSEYEEEIKKTEGFGEKSYVNMIAAIEKSKLAEMPNFIYALGINHVGLSNAKLLCRACGYSLEKIKSADEDQLIQIEGFGEIIAHSIYKYFHDEKNLEILKRAIEYIRFTQKSIPEELPLKGLAFVVTGELTRFKNRKELENILEEKGAKVAGSVSAKTSCLINNDLLSSSTKNKKAKELNIPILTEEKFLKKFLPDFNK